MGKRLRLRHAEDFAGLQREGSRYRHPFFILSVRANGLAHNRYGFITAKRLGKAVVRNRARRLLRESVRLLHPSLTPGFDALWIARPDIAGQSFATVQRAVRETCRRAALLNNEEKFSS